MTANHVCASRRGDGVFARSTRRRASSTFASSRGCRRRSSRSRRETIRRSERERMYRYIDGTPRGAPPPAPARSVRFAGASRRLRRATLGEPVERARRRRPIIIIIIIADRRSPHHRECVRHRNSRAPRARGSLEAGATLLGWALRRARIFDEGAFPLDGCWRARPAFKCADFAFTAGVGGGGRRGGFVGVSFRSTRRDPPWGGGAWSADAPLVRRDERRETLTRRALSFISRSRADGSGRPTCSTRATARLLAPRLRPRARGCTATGARPSTRRARPCGVWRTAATAS